ncbi:major paralogous domain-containing protein [Fibrobacter sp. UWH9]|uniref:FISUMP domain-containing protein n=1 Tax=Fibrobacter sp. UWH9 TaxID=1896213 RepID=UPI00091116A7|nr:FISUMP domain-containing protein [Fibrobacter sp. UWH9]SHH90500.1 major paralogous domain-containing protein [Fibrobacter sp. UWH9]
MLYLPRFVFFTACDDSSSGAGPEPVAEISSSSDGEHAISSSSVTDKETSSGGGLVSSSSVKSDSSSEQMNFSSVSGKNSSSSVVESSSSEYLFCNEGDRDTVVKDWGIKYYRCENNDWVVDTIVYVDLPKVYPNMDSLFDTKYTEYGEFEDPRDHQKYKTLILHKHDDDGNIVDGVVIEAFAQNLNYGVMIDTSVLVRDDNKVEKYCDLNDEWFCNNGWGGQYAWSEAMGLPAKYDSVLWKDPVGGDTRIHQGICPEGWHIMNGYEWKNFTSRGGLSLASKVNWAPLDMAGANLLGLSVLFKMRAYELSWMQAYFLLPNESSAIGTYAVTITDKYVWFGDNDHLGKHILYSVRCVKDY